jgi:hypothetical protein
MLFIMCKPWNLPRLPAGKFPSRIHHDSKGKRVVEQKYPQKWLPHTNWKTGEIITSEILRSYLWWAIN